LAKEENVFVGYPDILNFAFNSTMGNVSNVGLMARKAEEYGSHDKTVEIPADGKVVVRDKNSGMVRRSVREPLLWLISVHLTIVWF
jgi:monomeric isocitrate dehydrogenase